MTPGDVLNLSGWKITLPTGESEHPDEVFPISHYQDANFHVPGTDKAVVFRAPCGGVSTSGSGYPRCELREMSGDRLASWSSKSGKHTMSITQAITHLPAVKPHVVAGQIHDAGDDVVMIRLEGRKLFVESAYADDLVLDPAYRLGDVFKVTIQATSSGISIWYAKSPAHDRVKVHIPKTGSGWYFKAGCYTQSNTSKGDKASAYGEVVIHALTVTHESASAPSATPTLSDPRINESSGLAVLHKHPGYGVTLNDEPGPLFAINLSTGRTVSTHPIRVNGRTVNLVDPEAARARNRLWIADSGNNKLKRDVLDFYVMDEPVPGRSAALAATRYRVSFGKRVNIEALAIDAGGTVWVASKAEGYGVLYRLPKRMSKYRVNKAINTGVRVPELVSDMDFTLEGSHLLVLSKSHPGAAYALDTETWQVSRTLRFARLKQAESIAVTLDGRHALVGSEGKNSPLVTVVLPETFWPKESR